MIYGGYDKETKEEVAVKIMEIDNEVEDIIHEIEVMKKCKDMKNVVKFHGTFENVPDNEVWVQKKIKINTTCLKFC